MKITAINHNRESLAWAAGLFEGEGSFSMQQTKGRTAKTFAARLVMTDRDTVDRFHQVVGCGFVNQRKTSGTTSRKPQYEWRVQNFEHFQTVVALLWFWLCSRRRTRAKALLLEAREYYAGPRRGWRIA